MTKSFTKISRHLGNKIAHCSLSVSKIPQ